MKLNMIFLCIASLISHNIHAKAPNPCIANMDENQIGMSLLLDHCGLQDDDLPAVLSWLNAHQDVSYLNLSHNNIRASGAKLLAENLYVEYLYMDNNDIGSRGASYFADNQYIEHLSLRSNYAGTDSALKLANNVYLKSLDLGNNQVGTAGIIALAKNTTLQYLGLKANLMKPAAIEALIANKTLQGMDISYTDIHFEQIFKLMDRPILESLNVDGLHLGDGAARYISQKSTLKSLHMAENNLTDEGAIVLASANLKDIDISQNHIGDEGVLAFAYKNTYYLALRFMYNNVTNTGAFALAYRKFNILYVNASYNHIGSEGVDALQDSPVITFVDVDHNDDGKEYPLGFVHSYRKSRLDMMVLMHAKD